MESTDWAVRDAASGVLSFFAGEAEARAAAAERPGDELVRVTTRVEVVDD